MIDRDGTLVWDVGTEDDRIVGPETPILYPRTTIIDDAKPPDKHTAV